MKTQMFQFCYTVQEYEPITCSIIAREARSGPVTRCTNATRASTRDWEGQAESRWFADSEHPRTIDAGLDTIPIAP
jgi:hypothetical protein